MSTFGISLVKPSNTWRRVRRLLKRVLPFGLAILFVPRILVFYLLCGLIDVRRNRQADVDLLNRYFTGNGVFTWLLSPFNLFMDLLTIPYRNRGVYQLADLPKPYQEEIQSLINAASHSRLVEQLQSLVEGQERLMIFFKWYGKNIDTSIDVPEFRRKFNYIRTIGVSVFNKRQSTSKHYGPLRVTLRMLYNLNTIEDRNAYIQVGNCKHHWCDNKLFIFDDTLQHESHNETDAVRYCLFVDVLRPSLIPGIMQVFLSGVRVLMLRFNFVLYRNWKFIK